MRLTFLEMSLSASVIILILAVVRILVIHRLPKRTFVFLWLLITIRLLIPFTVPPPFHMTPPLQVRPFFQSDVLPDNPALPYADTPITAFDTVSQTVSDTAAALNALSLPDYIRHLIVPVWLAGCICCVLYFLIGHSRVSRRYRTSLPLAHPFLQELLAPQPFLRRVRIKYSDQISTPLTYGLFRPVILLPKNLDYADQQLLSHVLRHEMIHIRRCDILLKWVLAAALCVHWFNPLVWVMYILSNRDIELSCDEAVVRHFGRTTKSYYALSLIGLEEKRTVPILLCNHFCKNSIEGRIRAIMKIKKNSILGVTCAIALVSVTAFTLATTAAKAEDSSASKKAANQTESNMNTYAIETSDNKAENIIRTEILLKYEPYGLRYDQSKDRLYYKEELVRYFEDFYPVGDGAQAGYDYFFEDGTVDVHAVRDLSNLKYNADGSYDPSGVLTGVQPYSNQEFEKRDISDYLNPKTSSTNAVSASSGDSPTPEQQAERYAVYEPYGVSYDKEKNRLYFQGKPVRYFLDIYSSNGESMSGGKFKGSMSNAYFENGEVDIHTIRDYSVSTTFDNLEGVGKLTGVEADSQETFDERTENEKSSIWTEH